MGEWVPLTTQAGPVRGWLARPKGAPRGAVVLVQEIFGVNAHIRAVAERLAGEGFTTLAPALFDVLRPGVELRYDQEGVTQGRALSGELGFDRALPPVAAAAAWLATDAGSDADAGGNPRVGVVGFCWGGTVAMLANTRQGLPSVTYYGGRSVPFLDEPARAPMLFHFGERDRLIPPEDIALHRERHPGALIHTYPAGHGFNCEARGDYAPGSAALAWTRTVAFLDEHLRGGQRQGGRLP